LGKKLRAWIPSSVLSAPTVACQAAAHPARGAMKIASVKIQQESVTNVIEREFFIVDLPE
jgi:hypothetical protein